MNQALQDSDARARELLRTTFGFPGFRPQQEAIIAHLVRGRDACGKNDFTIGH